MQDVTADIAQRWGRLPVPRPENAIDKQIAATALICDLKVATRSHRDFSKTDVRLLNPCQPEVDVPNDEFDGIAQSESERPRADPK